MIVCGLDVETTGLCEPEHRLIEVYAAHYEFPSGKLESFYETRIDPQRAIAADAYRVHGISGMDLIGKPVFEDVAGPLSLFLGQADLTRVVYFTPIPPAAADEWVAK